MNDEANTAPRWIVSIPAWGGAYIAAMVQLALPSTAAAAKRFGRSVHLICHTNQPDRIEHHIPEDWTYEFRDIPHRPTYVTLQISHADAVAAAEPGERVLLLNADLVISVNTFDACEQHFRDGKQAIVTLGIRTAKGAQLPPIGAEPAALLEWAWEHRHQIIKDLEFPGGRSMLPTNLFFEHKGAVCARGFHLHPIAIIKREDTAFASTIDGDLLDCFPKERIHVVSRTDDVSMCEVSPPHRRFPVRSGHLTPERIAGSMRERSSPMHRWLVTHRIGVIGTYEGILDRQVVGRVLECLSSGRVRMPVKPPKGTPTGKRGTIPAGLEGEMATEEKHPDDRTRHNVEGQH